MKKYTAPQIIAAIILAPIWIPLGIITVVLKFNVEVVQGIWNYKA